MRKNTIFLVHGFYKNHAYFPEVDILFRYGADHSKPYFFHNLKMDPDHFQVPLNWKLSFAQPLFADFSTQLKNFNGDIIPSI